VAERLLSKGQGRRISTRQLHGTEALALLRSESSPIIWESELADGSVGMSQSVTSSSGVFFTR
jgi:hypothetical protein